MRSLTRALPAVVVTALLAAGCSTASSSAPAAHKPTPPSASASTPAAAPVATADPTLATGDYVALGDSYTAAPKISGEVGTPGGCGRSSDSYPLLVAQRLRLAPDRVIDVSCDGATITDLAGSQVTGDGTNPAQLDALSPATTLVTVGIGGNDVHWTSVLGECVKLDLVTVLTGNSSAQDATRCEKYYTSGGADKVQQYIQAAASPLTTALAEIKSRAPNARIYVIGYPDLVPASGDSACAHTFAITPADMAFVNRAEQQLNTMLRQQASDAGATYVDTYSPSLGHSGCATTKQRWVEPWVPTSPADPLHPDAAGEQGMANAVISALSKAG
jgi:lysophospholipase L1-like esterase